MNVPEWHDFWIKERNALLTNVVCPLVSSQRRPRKRLYVSKPTHASNTNPGRGIAFWPAPLALCMGDVPVVAVLLLVLGAVVEVTVDEAADIEPPGLVDATVEEAGETGPPGLIEVMMEEATVIRPPGFVDPEVEETQSRTGMSCKPVLAVLKTKGAEHVRGDETQVVQSNESVVLGVGGPTERCSLLVVVCEDIDA
jgi:hypothetical protein